MILRVITYNVRRGRFPGSRSTMKGIANALESAAPQVTCLQEVWNPVLPPGPESRWEEGLAKMGHRWVYVKNTTFREGHLGNAILSGFAVRRWTHLDISQPGVEPRGYVSAVLVVPGRGDLHVICVHLGLGREERRRQIDLLADQVRREVPSRLPLIVAGDFNDWKGELPRILGERLGLREAGISRRGRRIRTFPSWLPVFSLDQIYYRNLRLVRVGVPWRWRERFLSDHLPVRADFELKTLNPRG